MPDDPPVPDPRTAPVLAVVGPTATGKSDLGIALARCVDGEVVNADASQLYRGMDIGTAKVPVAQRAGVPHHQLDLLDVRQEASVARYQVQARADVAAVRSRGRVPVVVGGSGLYVRALLDRLEIPPTDPEVRARWEHQLLERGVADLHAELAVRDPEAAERIDPRNGRRVVRALEVIELTGAPFSATLPVREFLQPTVLIGLRADRDVLAGRITRRVRAMWDEGLVPEVEGLAGRGLREGRTAARALGYAQVLDQLDGRLTQEQAQERTAELTRRLARRQQAWFGPDPRVHWLPHDAPDLLDRALSLLGRPSQG